MFMKNLVNTSVNMVRSFVSSISLKRFQKSTQHSEMLSASREVEVIEPTILKKLPTAFFCFDSFLGSNPQRESVHFPSHEQVGKTLKQSIVNAGVLTFLVLMSTRKCLVGNQIALGGWDFALHCVARDALEISIASSGIAAAALLIIKMIKKNKK